MSLRKAWGIALLAGLAGCLLPGIETDDVCLKKFPGNPACCERGGHLTNGTCCPDGFHAVSDVEHVDWRVCTPDEDPPADAGICRDAAVEGELDAGTGAP